MPRIRIAQWDEQEIEANGVFGICRDLLIQFYRERNLPLFFSVNESLKRIPDMENGDFWAFDGIMAQAFTVTHVEPDPLQYCLQQESALSEPRHQGAMTLACLWSKARQSR